MSSKQPIATMSEVLHRTMKAVGCDPVVCHACGQPMDVGMKLGVNQGLFVHWGACEDVAEADMVAPMDEEIRQAVRAAFKELSDLALALNKPGPEKALEAVLDTGWTSGMTFHGPPPVDLFRQAGLF